MKILVGRDKLDFVKGVRQKLLAFEKFLEKHPEWHGKVCWSRGRERFWMVSLIKFLFFQVVLIQVALATTEENEQQTKVTDVVQRINARFSTLT
jgi:trehalose-6-phosphate synthase